MNKIICTCWHCCTIVCWIFLYICPDIYFMLHKLASITFPHTILAISSGYIWQSLVDIYYIYDFLLLLYNIYNIYFITYFLNQAGFRSPSENPTKRKQFLVNYRFQTDKTTVIWVMLHHRRDRIKYSQNTTLQLIII